jgi:hypothetical protein
MAKSLILAAHDLADLVEQENAALRSMDMRGAAMLLAKKAVAVRELAALCEASGTVSHPDLRAATNRLDTLALENRRLLERAIVAQRRVIGIIARAAVAAAAAGPAYIAPGRPPRPTRPMTLSTRA